MTRSDQWITPHPEAGRYHRPQLGIWRLWLLPDLWHTAQAAALTGVAVAATAVLAGIKFWRHVNDDETGE